MGIFRRSEFKPGQYTPRYMRNGLIFLGITGLLFYFAFSGGSIPLLPKGGYTVKADFRTAANVQAGKTPVRVKGVEVGTVEKVDRQADGRGVVVTMRITKDDQLPRSALKDDARADIYWRTLLGFAFYIELTPGADTKQLAGTIPEARTTAQVELDQVLASVDKPSRKGMQTLFREFDKGFNGTSAAGRTLDELAPAFTYIGPGIDALRGQRDGDLTATIRNSSKLMGVLARNEVALGGLVDGADTTLGVTAARRADLASMLQNGPSTLDETSRTMVRLRGTLDALDPVAENLRPGVRRLDDASRALRPALHQLSPLLKDARPFLKDIRPALRSLGSASRTGVPLLQALDPTFDTINDKIVPGLQKQSPETKLKAYEAIGPTFASVSSTASMFDARGYTQRFEAVNGGENSLGFLPCSPDLLAGKVDCSDLKVVVGRMLGIPVATNSKGKLVMMKKLPPTLKASGPRSGTGAPSTASPRSSAGTSASGATAPPAEVSRTATKVAKGVRQLAASLKGLI